MINIDSSLCTGCGACARVCPHRVIEVVERRAVLAAEDRCIECGACQLNCHDGAVAVTVGTGCVFAIAQEVWLQKGEAQGECGAEP